MYLYLLLGFFSASFIFLLIYIFYLKNHNNSTKLSEDFFNKFNQNFPQILNQANQNLTTMADQKLSGERKNIETLIFQIQESLKQVESGRLSTQETLKTELQAQAKLTEKLSVTTEGLKNVLSNNQLRGAFGEQVAEDLLKMAGFVSGNDYDKQLESGDSRPDFSIYMPDGSVLNVDAKFPYANLVKMTEGTTKSEKDQYEKLLKQDIKNKIKEVFERGYVDSTKNTLDFVILFIPNEMVFSFIYEKYPDLWQEAIKNKIILAGPFGFTALIRLIRQSYDSFKVQKNIKKIIQDIQTFQSEFEKYNQEFEKIGERLDSLVKQYDTVKTTRTRQLVRVVDKISLTA